MVYQQIGQVFTLGSCGFGSESSPTKCNKDGTNCLHGAVLGVRGVTSPRDPRVRHHCCSGDGGHILHPLGHDDQWDFNLLTLKSIDMIQYKHTELNFQVSSQVI